MKKLRLIGLLTVISLLMTGCGLDAMPDLTDEESAIITEYAAGLLLKYSPNYDYKIVDDVGLLTLEEQTEEESEVVESSEPEAGTETTTEAETLAEAEPETQSEALDNDISAVSLDSDLAEVLGIEDSVSIVYSSYEICDSYPETSTGFSVSATQGGKLLVVHFDLTNETGADGAINLMDYNVSAVATVNAERQTKALNTLLPNDIISYYNNMKSGETDDVVMLFQISGDLAENLEKLSLKISASGSSTELNIE